VMGSVSGRLCVDDGEQIWSAAGASQPWRWCNAGCADGV